MAKPRPTKRKRGRREVDKNERKDLYFSLLIAFMLTFSVFAAAYSGGMFAHSKKQKLPSNLEINRPLSAEEINYILSNGKAVLEVIVPKNCSEECMSIYNQSVQLIRIFYPILYLSTYGGNVSNIVLNLYTPLETIKNASNITVIENYLCSIVNPKPTMCVLNEIIGNSTEETIKNASNK